MSKITDLLAIIRGMPDYAVVKALDELLPRWIPVEERLPPDGVLVLAYGKRAEYGFRRDGQWIDTLYGGVLANGPTHWMPLPEPPEANP